ncbi:hypothetical protein P170DRAFT_481302 [Aspergillus steynii IBT 23096]|uniref:Deoxyribonuclease NucA/NucB domain-containing protein n=1 Tax=Aspergillus steynii IBT 23096 TaxID=1392250 RepID=A0A2I2FRU5_9EURO|nr:uncharacterized protein P170DRAFT_481302 [Aspergillus steynii IBT 23096]PLB43355.1 hypothetical protein P170DRAFT_481302 [Aspergillus steynii IBT 23096]
MKHLLLYFLLFALSLGSAVPEAPAPDTQVAVVAKKHLTFDCSDGQVGDVCLNMCYGAKCKRLGSTFTWDKPKKNVGEWRSRLAGCDSRNRCTRAPYGDAYQCDEYPFKSVKEADKGRQVNRCVKTHYNGRQFKGKGCNGRPSCQFTVSFKNFSKHKCCKKKPNCKNDGNQYTKAGLAKRQEDVDNSGYYRLSSGDIIFVSDGASVGDMVYQTIFTNSNATMGVDALADTHEDDDRLGDDEFEVQEDRIVEEVADYE